MRFMIYQAYQAQMDAMAPFRMVAGAAVGMLAQPLPGMAGNAWLRAVAAACELASRARLNHSRPDFALPTVTVGDLPVAVTIEPAARTDFCTLLHFRKAVTEEQPRVLLVAPLSGHFATLLRDTVRTMLPDHDVYLTDWHNGRDVPLQCGRFGLDDFIGHVIGFLDAIGPGGHVVAICQPCAAVLAAAAIMAEDGNPALPRSMTLMAGPVDARINPTKVNQFATARPIAWFEQNLIGVVPQGFKGAMRRVYPGFLQLGAFMGMNATRHLKSLNDLYQHRIAGEEAKAEAAWNFYDEYFAVMDLPAEFYLETVRTVFQTYDVARGVLRWRGRRVDPGAIARMQLLTVEGERDDICSVGQTLAAHDLCTRLRPYMKRHYVQTGVGHYGVFSGRRWSREIYPLLRDVIHAST